MLPASNAALRRPVSRCEEILQQASLENTKLYLGLLPRELRAQIDLFFVLDWRCCPLISREIAYSAAPIKTPLVKGLDASQSKNALSAFTTIMMFMQDLPLKGRPAELLHNLFDKAIDYPLLRDEIYAQLLKQTNEHVNPAHCLKGWQLMSLCARVFVPSEKMLPYLVAYLQDAINKKGKQPQEGELAEAVLSRLKVTQLYGGRTHAPSVKQIETMLLAPAIQTDVLLSDGYRCSLNIDSATVVAEVIPHLLKRTKLPYRSTWGICEVIAARDYDRERVLSASDNLCDVLASWRHFKAPKGVNSLDFLLIYKKVAFMSNKDRDLTDPRFEQLLYHQCVYDVISCKQPVVEEEVVKLGGLYLQLTKGNYSASTAAKTVEGILPDLVPTPFRLTRPANYWVPKLVAEWVLHANRLSLALRFAYVERVSQGPLFGSPHFNVKYALTNKKGEIEASLGITKDGLHLREIYSKTTLRTWRFSEILSWAPAKSLFTIVTGDLANPRREVFRTQQAEDIAVVYKAYIACLAATTPP